MSKKEKSQDYTDRADVYVTSQGVPIFLKEIPPLLIEKVRDSVPEPDIPTYTAELVGGATQTYEHTAKTEKSEEEQEEWMRYLVKKEMANRERTEKATRCLFNEGIIWDKIDLPKDDDWIERQREYGLDIPEKERKLKFRYLETVLIASTADIGGLTLKIMAMTPNVRREAVEAAEGFFRRMLEGQTDSEPEDEGGTVELHLDIPDSPDDAEVGEGS